jgi:hypothetical protein
MPFYIGTSIGDKLGQVFPIRIDGPVFTSELTTLLPQGLAANVGITHLHQAPDMIQGPPTILEDGTKEPTALLPQGLAANVGIIHLHQAPDMIQGPPTILEDGTKEPTAPSLERLHFGTSENDDPNQALAPWDCLCHCAQ